MPVGAPEGNQNATKDRRMITDALRRAAAQSPNKLKNACEKLLDKAEEGDIMAFREIADRLDGKPTQAIEGKIDHDHTGTITHEHKDGMNFTEIQEKRQKLRVIEG